jgi:hypothetical protein
MARQPQDEKLKSIYNKDEEHPGDEFAFIAHSLGKNKYLRSNYGIGLSSEQPVHCIHVK